MNPMKTALPPGPAGRWWPTLQLIRNPRQALERWRAKYGDPFLVHALNGPVVITAREDLLREIHGQDPASYEPFAQATLIPILGAGSMLVLSGEMHRRERRLIMPMFHGDRMKAYGNAMQAVAIDQMDQRRTKGTIATLEMMTSISLEVIARTIFGGTESAATKRLIAASKRVVASANPLLFFSVKTHRSLFGFSPWDRWRQMRATLVAALDDVIETRQKQTEPADDVLSLLLNAKYEDGQPIDRDHLHAELLTFLFAGHETTSLAMTWAIHHLHHDANVLHSLRSELDALPDDTAASLAAAPYLKAVVQETLRVHPIVTETLRKLLIPMQLGEYQLPAGFAVAPATVLAHYNPETYSQPERFMPERFLQRSYSPFQYMPFGGGHRRCIGAAFAMYEMAIVIGTLIKRYEIELCETRVAVPKRRSVTMGPSSVVPIHARPRVA